MGEPGTVRIVGQVRAAWGRSVSAVRFSVDGTLLGTVTGGPPYAVEWTDDNPCQRREIVVEAEDNEGDVGRDRVVLEPYVVTELAEVTSVLVEAGVYDKKGRRKLYDKLGKKPDASVDWEAAAEYFKDLL